MRVRVVHNEHDGSQVLDADTGKPLDLKITKVTVVLEPDQPPKALMAVIVDEVDVEADVKIEEEKMR